MDGFDSGYFDTTAHQAVGGGATHIAKSGGKLMNLSSNLSDILIVAGGGGGGGMANTVPGNGGGYIGGKPKYNGTAVDGMSGTQSSGYAFGQGESNGDVLDVSWQIYPSDDVVVPIRIYGGSLGENRNTTIGELKILLRNKGFNQAILAHDGYAYMIFTNFGNVSSDLYLADKDYLQVINYKTIGFNFPAVTRFEQTTHWEIYRDGSGIANQTGSVWNNVATTTIKDGTTYYYLITNNPQSFENHPPIYVTTYNGTIKYNNKTSPTRYENVSAGGGGLYGGYRGIAGSTGAGAGSGYIGNPLLSNKAMYGNDVPPSTDEDTSTKSTKGNVSATPRSKWAKIGDGYVRITYKGPKAPVPPTPAADFFRPDFSTDGRDTIRYDANDLVTLYELPGGSGLEADYITGACYMDYSTEYEWYLEDGALIAPLGWSDRYCCWGYGTNHDQQQLINATSVVKIGASLSGLDFKGEMYLFKTPECPDYSDNLIFTFTCGSAYITGETNGNSINLWDENTAISGTHFEYQVYLQNGIITKIEYYIDDVLYNTFDNLNSYNVAWFNTKTQNTPYFNELAFSLSYTGENDPGTVTVSDLYITYT